MRYDDIKPYIEQKLISEQAHPEDRDIRIFNYTQHCQFEQAWNPITKACRGLIMNIKTNEIIARPFEKFFNYEEHIAKGWPIPTDEPMVISEKLDGSLGILYILDGKPWIATRGSFTSDQAIWATEWYRKNVEQGEIIEPGITNLFEIIYPENRIVVNYDFSGLVHLASIENATGKTVPIHWGEPIRKAPTITTQHAFSAAYVEETLKKSQRENFEGFVIYFPISNVRIKIKLAEYVRLHKLVTGVSEIAIWEHLRDGNDLDDLLEKVPDEFFQWVKKVQDRLAHDFWCIEEEAWIVANEAKKLKTRKEQAIYINEHTRRGGIAFSILDGKDYKPAIWRIVRPIGQKAFKNDIDL